MFGLPGLAVKPGTATPTGLTGAWPSGDAVFVLARDGLHSVDATTGNQRWSLPVDNLDGASFGVDSGLLIIGIKSGGGKPAVLRVLDAVTGQQRWRSPAADGLFRMDANAGLICAGSDDMKAMHAFYAPTGHRRWTFHPPGTDLLAGLWMTAEAVYTAGSRTFRALDRANGHTRWTAQTAGTPTGGIAVAGGVVYFGADDLAVYAVDTATGHQRWCSQLPGAAADLATAADLVVMGGKEGTLRALDRADGRQRWTVDLGGISSLNGADSVVYAASDGLYAIRAS